MYPSYAPPTQPEGSVGNMSIYSGARSGIQPPEPEVVLAVGSAPVVHTVNHLPAVVGYFPFAAKYCSNASFSSRRSENRFESRADL